MASEGDDPAPVLGAGGPGAHGLHEAKLGSPNFVHGCLLLPTNYSASGLCDIYFFSLIVFSAWESEPRSLRRTLWQLIVEGRF